jgi:hypothetical protein
MSQNRHAVHHSKKSAFWDRLRPQKNNILRDVIPHSKQLTELFKLKTAIKTGYLFKIWGVVVLRFPKLMTVFTHF